MSSVAQAESSKSIAVTVIGLGTLLVGGSYAAFGGWAIFAGADCLMHPSKEPMAQVIALGGIVPALVMVFGIAFLLPGILGLLAGLGVLLRKQWGRILTFVLAVLAVLLGMLWVRGAGLDAIDIAIGGAQVLYGITALVILIQKGAEFSRPQASISVVR